MKPILKGILWAVIGFTGGAGLLTLVRLALGMSLWDLEPAISVGYIFGLTGWLLGVGVWDYWARAWFGLPLKKFEANGLSRYFSFNLDHKVIGLQYLAVFFFMLLTDRKSVV